ncbi:MAG: ATP-binding cassette domain-containing protein [Lachnospira sp.]|nr:ATP-binding cassette domain-containing protein [Lachnospira sp.]
MAKGKYLTKNLIPLQLDTIMNNRGTNLSGGQRQRIAIARAIIKNAPIILMDEATSALDNESEQMIADAISRLRNQKTVLMIAHRKATIQLADSVVEC